jgi:hypothetical protein
LHLGAGAAFAQRACGCDGSPPAQVSGVCAQDARADFVWITPRAWLPMGPGLAVPYRLRKAQAAGWPMLTNPQACAPLAG